MTVSNAVSPAGLNVGGVTIVTSGSPRTAVAVAAAAACGSADPPALTTTISGPLNPGPKPSESRSYALRWVEAGAAVLSSGSPSSRSVAGIANAPRPITVTSSTATGRRVTNRAHRRPADMRPAASGSPARRPGIRPPRTRRPAKPSSAGSSVSAIATASTTVNAAANPIWVRNGMSTTNSPASAITTVSPANTTADPAVPTARPTASSGSSPVPSSCR